MTEQAHGSNARLILTRESEFGVNPTVLVENCENAWTQGTANTTVTADATLFKQGSKSAKMAVGAAAGAGDLLATKAITAIDLTGKTKLVGWMRSSVALAEGDLQLCLDDTAACASPLELIDLPAIVTANVDTWMPFKVDIATPAALTAVISVGVKMIVDKGAFDFYVDDIRAIEADAVVIPWSSGDLGKALAREKSKALSGDRNPRSSTPGAVTAGGAIEVEMNPYLAFLLEGLLGQVATESLGGGVYKHTFTIKANPLPTYTAEVQLPDIGVYRVITGCAIDDGTIKLGATGKIDGSFTVKAADEATDTLETTLDPDPTDYGHDPFDAFDVATGDILEDGSAIADVVDLSFKLSNGRSGKPTIGSQGALSSLPGSIADVSGMVNILFKTTTVYRKATGNTLSSLEVTLTRGTGAGTLGNEKMTIEVEELKYDVPKVPISDSPIELGFNFNGEYNTGTNASALTITLWNTQATV